MRPIAVLLAAVALAPAAAIAAPILEVEANNTPAQANVILPASYPAGAFAFDGALVPGDVDYIRFTTTSALTIVDASTFGVPNSQIGDTQLIMLNSALAIVAFADNGGIGAFASMEATVPAGTYYIGVTGADDLGVRGPNGPHLPTGAHQQALNYKLIVGFNEIPVPTPGSAALLGVAGLASLRRRR